MVAIARGQFMMGDMYFGYEDHRPVHRVSVQDFAIGRYEVTFDEWDACARGGGCVSNPNPSDQGWGRGRRPVINVSWHDAQEYVQWLSARTGQSYRLPSEAEWEYADNEPRPYSAEWVGLFARNSQQGPGAVPVGSHEPNFFGVYDKVGNVREWVQDRWHESFDGAPSDGSAWMGPGDSNVLRDLSWQHGVDGKQEQVRSAAQADDRDETVGFRVARSLTGVRNPNPLPTPLSGPLEPPLEDGYFVYGGAYPGGPIICGETQSPVTLTREVTLHASRNLAAPVIATVRSGDSVNIVDCRVHLRPIRGEVLRTDYGFEAGRPVYFLQDNAHERFFMGDHFESSDLADYVWHQGEVFVVPYDFSPYMFQWEQRTSGQSEDSGRAVCWFELEARGVRGWGQSADIDCYWTRPWPTGE